MGTVGTVIHVNNALPHQRALGAAFLEGFERHGIRAQISPHPETPADTHVVLGPHFALGMWKHHPRCLHIDRAFWGDPDCVSVGWHQPDGSRIFPDYAGDRPTPSLEASRSGRDCIVLADYGEDGEDLAALVRPHVASVTIRRHPAEGGAGTLSEAMEGNAIAIGKMTTALIDAAINGLAIVCRDRRNPVMPVASPTIRGIVRPDRVGWLKTLAWGNWSHAEIAAGDCWEWITRCNS